MRFREAGFFVAVNSGTESDAAQGPENADNDGTQAKSRRIPLLMSLNDRPAPARSASVFQPRHLTVRPDPDAYCLSFVSSSFSSVFLQPSTRPRVIPMPSPIGIHSPMLCVAAPMATPIESPTHIPIGRPDELLSFPLFLFLSLMRNTPCRSRLPVRSFNSKRTAFLKSRAAGFLIYQEYHKTRFSESDHSYHFLMTPKKLPQGSSSRRSPCFPVLKPRPPCAARHPRGKSLILNASGKAPAGTGRRSYRNPGRPSYACRPYMLPLPFFHKTFLLRRSL